MKLQNRKDKLSDPKHVIDKFFVKRKRETNNHLKIAGETSRGRTSQENNVYAKHKGLLFEL